MTAGAARVACALALLAPPLAAQLGPPDAGGILAFDRALARAAEHRRVLVVAAHPDDENTELLALVATGWGGDAAYLSLSRGDGGQNLIGSHLGADLGLVRSGELEAARATDGARQFFTRAFDFGFSKTLEEAERFWPLDSVLKDAVRVVRRFRPHVMVAVFTGTPRDGHGQHQEAGVVAQMAFAAAGDATRFPELEREEGLRPWTPLKLYRSAFFDTLPATVTLDVGVLDPVTGRSIYQVAMASRSKHRSQDFGRLQLIGPQSTRLRLVTDRTGAGGAELFAGIPRDTAWTTRLADSLRRVTTAVNLADAVPALAGALRRLRGQDDFEAALLAAGGIAVDAVASDDELVPGERLDVALTVANGGAYPVLWSRAALAGVIPMDTALADTVPPGRALTRRLTVAVPSDAPVTQPYFLARPLQGAMYDWSTAPPAVRGLPFDPPILQAHFGLSLLGASVQVTREVARRVQDQALGELRHPLRVVPDIEVAITPDVSVWPLAAPPERTFQVTLRSHADSAIAGRVRLDVEGWPAPVPQAFRLAGRGASQVLAIRLTRPRGARAGTVTVRALAEADDGRVFQESAPEIAYPHIRPRARVIPARARVTLADVTLPDVGRIGYIRGAADRVPEALADVGLRVEVLGPDQLESDLSGYGVIVVGPRAYETDSSLMRHNDRLLAYARNGGRVLVQYQQYAFVRGQYAPLPLAIAQPHDRVTDETAAVRVLEPDHPAFRSPNVVGPGDWDGWPQERGLYFAHTWDDAYRPLLEMHDPGEGPQRGSLLVTRLGRGTYTYTGLSFFRALPAGVPGAMKLFLNLMNVRVSDVP